MQNMTWDLVHFLPNLNVVGNKWGFKLKLNVDDSI